MNDIVVRAKFKDDPQVYRWFGSDIYSDELSTCLTVEPYMVVHINTKLCEWYIVKNPKWLKEE